MGERVREAFEDAFRIGALFVLRQVHGGEDLLEEDLLEVRVEMRVGDEFGDLREAGEDAFRVVAVCAPLRKRTLRVR